MTQRYLDRDIMGAYMKSPPTSGGAKFRAWGTSTLFAQKEPDRDAEP